jgi:HK97 family phage prohead protease
MRYTLPLEIKASGESGIIAGYASTFGPPADLHGDIVMPGAFADSLASHLENDTLPAMLFGHDQKSPVGVWQEVREDDVGLWVSGRLTMAVQAARDAFELAKDGALALSIGFTPVKQHRDADANMLEAIALGEISLVGLASNPKAKITSVKSLNSIREYESLLRENFGLSTREAKRLSMGGWKAYQPGHETELKQIADLIRGSAHKFGV